MDKVYVVRVSDSVVTMMANVNGVGYSSMILDTKKMTKPYIEKMLWGRMSTQAHRECSGENVYKRPKLRRVKFIWLKLEDFENRNDITNQPELPIGNVKPKKFVIEVDVNGKPKVKGCNELLDEDEVKIKLLELALKQ